MIELGFKSLTSLLISTVKGNDKIPVVEEFEDSSIYGREEVFAAVGIKEIKSLEDFSDDKGVKSYRFCEIEYSVTIFGKNPDGGNLLEIAENMYAKLFSSGLNIESVNGGATSFNAKLGRLQYDFVVTLNARLLGNEVTCTRQSVAIALSDKLTFSLVRFEFERDRALSEILSVCSGVIVGDGGEKPLTLKLCGNISSQNFNALVELDCIIFLGMTINLNCLGLKVPPLKLKKYLFKGEKGAVSSYCELFLWGENPAEVIAVE